MTPSRRSPTIEYCTPEHDEIPRQDRDDRITEPREVPVRPSVDRESLRSQSGRTGWRETPRPVNSRWSFTSSARAYRERIRSQDLGRREPRPHPHPHFAPEPEDEDIVRSISPSPSPPSPTTGTQLQFLQFAMALEIEPPSGGKHWITAEVSTREAHNMDTRTATGYIVSRPGARFLLGLKALNDVGSAIGVQLTLDDQRLPDECIWWRTRKEWKDGWWWIAGTTDPAPKFRNFMFTKSDNAGDNMTTMLPTRSGGEIKQIRVDIYRIILQDPDQDCREGTPDSMAERNSPEAVGERWTRLGSPVGDADLDDHPGGFSDHPHSCNWEPLTRADEDPYVTFIVKPVQPCL